MSFFFSSQAYNTGNTTSVKIVALINPPITTVANGRCTSAPALVEIAMGKNPKAAAEAVSKTGLKRSWVPRLMRSSILVTPSLLSSLKCSINTIPLSTAIPKRAINPTPAEILNGKSLIHKNRIPPTAESGMAE